MRIGLLVDHLSVKEGTGIARYAHELLTGLRRRGVEVEVISTKSPEMPFGDAFNHAIRMPFHVLKKARGIDLIHATAPITGLCFPLVRTPKVVTYHDLGSYLYKDSSVSFHRRLAAPFFFRVGKYADKIIAVSTQTKEELVTYFGFPEDKIVVINPGISDEFQPSEREKENEYFSIGYMGALAPRKRVDFAIRALHYLRKDHPELEIRFSVYGNKEQDYQKLVELVKRLGLTEYVEFKGFAPEDKLVEIYNSFDIFVLPSDWEGFGIPILEAQRCGLPVIVREDALIPSETSKCCIKVKTEEDMADKIYNLLENHDWRENIIKGGLEYSKQFTWERAIEKTIKVYREVLT
jgi:glycosyltransferase involved in cell wall biosynthesis